MDQQAKAAELEIGAIADVVLRVEIVLGSTRMRLSEIARLTKDSIISLDRNIDEPVDVFVNGKRIARGELVLVDESQSRIGVSIVQIGDGAPNGARE